MALAEVPDEAVQEYKLAMQAVGQARWLLSRIAHYGSIDSLGQIGRLIMSAHYHAGRLSGLCHCAAVWEPFNLEKIETLSETVYNAVKQVSAELLFLMDVLQGGQ
jgi:hypothetical protein